MPHGMFKYAELSGLAQERPPLDSWQERETFRTSPRLGLSPFLPPSPGTPLPFWSHQFPKSRGCLPLGARLGWQGQDGAVVRSLIHRRKAPKPGPHPAAGVPLAEGEEMEARKPHPTQPITTSATPQPPQRLF